MSNFRDTFTKEDQGEKTLDYDESAFYYFASSVLIVVLLPCIYNFIRYGLIGVAKSKVLPFNHSKDRTVKSCQCSICQQKLVEKQKLVRPTFSQRFNFGRLMQFLAIGFMVFCLYHSLEEIKNSPQGLKKFDPYEILEIPYGSTDKEIRSAFRKMSVKFHPDKNPGDNLAAGRYMKITKAYEALTSELARHNWEKYGNPDGPQPLRVRIIVVCYWTAKVFAENGESCHDFVYIFLLDIDNTTRINLLLDE
jgi:translocation protein SEC63